MGGVAERLTRQVETGFVAQCAAAGFHFGGDGGEVGGIGNDGDVFPVFRGGAHHGRAADVDVFNRVFQRAVWLGDGGGEGVEVHAHQVDVADVVLFHSGNVIKQIAPAENAAVDFWMQRFHAAVEHFGEACIVGHFDDGNARIGQELGRAAGGEDGHAELVERAGKFDGAGFVGKTDQGTFDFGEHGDSFVEWDDGKGLPESEASEGSRVSVELNLQVPFDQHKL